MKNIIIHILKKIIRIIEDKSVNKNEIDQGWCELFGKHFHYHNKPAFEITFHEILEKGIYTFNSINEKPVIIDCGANMGLSLIFFHLNYPQSEITAFEPDESVLECLEKNIETYEMKNVTLHKKAVWDSNGSIDFFTDKGMGGRVNYNYSSQTPVKVETIRLKDVIGKNHIDFLKMDIEGAEFRVIKDCEPVLKQIDNIFIEYHSLIDEEQKLDDLLLFLKNSGFRYHLSQSFSRNKPFIDKYLMCEKMDLAINIFGYR